MLSRSTRRPSCDLSRDLSRVRIRHLRALPEPPEVVREGHLAQEAVQRRLVGRGVLAQVAHVLALVPSLGADREAAAEGAAPRDEFPVIRSSGPGCVSVECLTDISFRYRF